MTKGFWKTVGSAGGWLALVLAAGSIEAQETNAVGNPQLRDFELPGTTTVPQPAQQEPVTVTPPPAPPAPTADEPGAADDTPAARRDAPSTRERRTDRRTERAASPNADPAETENPAEAAPALPDPGAALAPPAAATAPEPEPQAEAEPFAFPPIPTNWIYAGAGVLLALLALFGLVKWRRARAARIEADAVAAEAAPEGPREPDPLFARSSPAKAAPVPAAPKREPIPVPTGRTPIFIPTGEGGGGVGISLRPRLELQFKPDRAAATLTETSVQYELVIINAGNKMAKNVRVQARMFNAGAEQEREIGDFFADPGEDRVPVAIPGIPPRGQATFRNQVTMPKDQVREITIQGRRLFVPMVAFNVLYDWDPNHSGQTSTSYLVGREAPTPSEKMGAFRLDLGPRLYRSVGQRQASLAKVV
jgi:hypothetical protein